MHDLIQCQHTKIYVNDFRKPRSGRLTDAKIQVGDFIIRLDDESVEYMNKNTFYSVWKCCKKMTIRRKTDDVVKT